jgi:hypothetical protein
MAVMAAQSAWERGSDLLHDVAVHGAAAIERWIVDGYDRAPALMAGLAIVVMVPLVALAGAAFDRIVRARRRASLLDPPVMRTEIAAAAGLGWPCAAWLTVDGNAPQVRQAVPRELLSIGREDDNDLRLDDATVHRHHAVLHRNSEAQYLIRELSGRGGNGVKVNGRRVDEVALTDGDRIEIGAVVLRFEAQPA